MRRRDFITLLGGVTVALPFAADAQQPKRLPTVGFLGAGTASAGSQWAAAFVQRLRELSWTEDQTIAIEFRWADGHNEHITEIAAESSGSRSMSLSPMGTRQPSRQSEL